MRETAGDGRTGDYQDLVIIWKKRLYKHKICGTI